MYAACLAFLILSGMAALVYQVTWVRLLGLSMGSTSASVGTVLAAFFLGMSLGSVLARRFVRRRVATLLPYVVLEALIGGAGLVLLPVLLRLDSLVATVPALGEYLAFKFVLAMALLVVPCVCIGATFPVMANVLIRHQDEIGLRFGQLYSVNTLGAVLGAALSGFVLIPAFGLDGAVYLAAGANFLIVLGGVALMRATALGAPYAAPAEAATPATEASPAPPGAGWALAVLFLTGFASIAAEVGYTKYAAIFAGTTIYGFSAVLSIFLVGITLGSWLIRRRIDRIADPRRWVAWGLVALAAGLALTRSGLNLLPRIDALMADAALPVPALWLIRFTALFVLLVVPTALFGALFPLNLKLYCGGLSGVSDRTGRGYAVNTLGGILGSVLAGFVVIPWLGTDLLLLGTAALMAVAAVPLAAPAGGAGRAALAGAVAVLAALWLLPRLDFEPMIAARSGGGIPRTFTYLKEGRTSVVTVSTTDGARMELANNGLTESVIWAADPRFGGGMGVLLGAIPYLLHPDPKSAFQVGFGGGITTQALTTTDLKSIHVVELEPVVVEAVRKLHGGTIPALADPRVRLDIDDARHRLLLEKATYDLIVSQPSHPWVAGSANVFTRDFYALVASKLNPGGIATQWVNLFHMDTTTLGTILTAFYGVFPHGAAFGQLGPEDGSLMLVGSDQPLSFDHDRIAGRLRLTSVAGGQIAAMLPDPDELFQYYVLTRDEALGVVPGATPNTDTNILCEVRLARLERPPVGADNPFRAVVAHARYDVAPYLAEPRARRMFGFGTRFIEHDQFGMALRVEERLETLDPAVARYLRHERLAKAYFYPEATALYAAHDDWPDTAHYSQALIFMETGRLDDARDAIARMRVEAVRRMAQVQLLFHAGQWDELAAFPARTPGERAWQLMGAFRRNPDAAAADLAALQRAHPTLLELPQLRVLAGYQRAHPAFARDGFDAYGALARASYAEGRRLAVMAREAKEDGRMDRARALLGRLDRVVDTKVGFGRQVRREILSGAG